jgi:hypothetical protein
MEAGREPIAARPELALPYLTDPPCLPCLPCLPYPTCLPQSVNDRPGGFDQPRVR